MSSVDIQRFGVGPKTRLMTCGDAERVAEHLRKGSPAVLPTDTGYMLSVPALDAAAVERLFETKQRRRTASVHIACASPEMAMRYGRFVDLAERALYDLLPGPVSLVVPVTEAFTTPLAIKDGTVGVRIPGCFAALQTIAALGEPVTATSLNPSGQVPITDPTDDALASLEWPANTKQVVVVEDNNALVYEQPSTMVRLDGDEMTVIRPGPVSLGEIHRRLMM